MREFLSESLSSLAKTFQKDYTYGLGKSRGVSFSQKIESATPAQLS